MNENVTGELPLSGRVALITGASSGIGRATAHELAAAGARVIVTARRGDRLKELVTEIRDADGKADSITADVSDNADIDRLWKQSKAAAGGGTPDLIVANAGHGLAGGVLSSDESVWEEMFRLNVLGTMHLMRTVAEPLAALEGARDLFVVGSTVGDNISPFSAAYGATKFAIHSAAEALRRELGPRGVRVTVVKPGIVSTEFQDVAGYDRENFGKATEKFGPPLEPEDVAQAIRFVAAQPSRVHLSDFTIRPTGQDYP